MVRRSITSWLLNTQVLMNLLVNTRDAMPDGITLNIAIERVGIEGASEPRHVPTGRSRSQTQSARPSTKIPDLELSHPPWHMKPHPTLKIRHARTTSLNASDAVSELRSLLEQDQSRLILFFCSADYDLVALASELNSAFGSIPTVGCTAAGQLGPEGFTSGGITAISLAGDITAHPFAVDLATLKTRVPAVAHDTKRLIADHPALGSFGLLLVDGLSLKEEQLTSLLYRHLPHLPVVGGSASGHLAINPATHVYVDGAFRSGSAVFTLLQTQLPFQPIKFAHFTSSGDTLVVTRSDPDTRVVYEINGRPSAEVYAEHVNVAIDKLDTAVFSMHPLILEMGGDQYVRAISSVNPDQSLTLYCVVEDGVVLSTGRALDPTATARSAFQRAANLIGDVGLVIGCDCISRRLQFEASGMMPVMSEIMKANQVFGFSTYGEQYDGLHMNQTFTGVAIGIDHATR